MDTVLDDVAFLANSENRVSALDRLADGPCSRHELADSLDVSRVTLSRILRDMTDRRWIRRRGQRYELTALGSLVDSAFADLASAIELEHKLRDVLHLLPLEDIDLPLDQFRSVEVLLPDARHPMAHMDCGLDLVRTTDRCRVLARLVLPQFVTVIRNRAVAGDLEFDAVVPGEVVAELDERPELRADLHAVVDAGGTLARYDGRIPFNLFVADDTVFFWLCDRTGTDQAALLSTSRAVRTWADATFREYRRDANSVELSLPAR